MYTSCLTRGSRFENFLAVFKWENVGCYNWGLVSGKTNTIYQWDTVYDSEPDPWFCDIFRKDGTPYREWEVRLIRELTSGVGEGNRGQACLTTGRSARRDQSEQVAIGVETPGSPGFGDFQVGFIVAEKQLCPRLSI